MFIDQSMKRLKGKKFKNFRKKKRNKSRKTVTKHRSRYSSTVKIFSNEASKHLLYLQENKSISPLNDFERNNKTEISMKHIPIMGEPHEPSVADSVKLQFVKLQKFGFPIEPVNSVSYLGVRDQANGSNISYKEDIDKSYNAFSGKVYSLTLDPKGRNAKSKLRSNHGLRKPPLPPALTHIGNPVSMGRVRSIRPLPNLKKVREENRKNINLAIEEANDSIVLTNYRRVRAPHQSKSVSKYNK